MRWSWIGIAAIALTASPQQVNAQGKIELSVPLPELEKHVKADSNDPAAHYNVALGYWNAKKWDDVDRELHEAVKLQPRFAEAHLALAFLPYVRQPKIWTDLAEATHELAGELRKTIAQSDREYRQAFVIDPMVDMRIMATAMPRTPSFWDMAGVLGETFANYVHGKIDCAEGHYTDCEAKFTRILFNMNSVRSTSLPTDGTIRT